MRRDWGLWPPQRALTMENQSPSEHQGERILQDSVLSWLRGEAQHLLLIRDDKWASDETRLWDFSSSTLSTQPWNVIIIHQCWTQSGVPEADCHLQIRVDIRNSWVSVFCTYTQHTHLCPFLKRYTSALRMESSGIPTEKFCAPDPAPS